MRDSPRDSRRDSPRDFARGYTEPRLLGLGALAVGIRWLTELLMLANILLLMLGSTIAATDLLTNGALTHLSGTFDLVWGASQAVTVELLFITAFVRAARYARQGRHGAMVGWIVVGLILAVPTVQASLVYSMTRTLGISTTQALTLLHLPVFTWLVTRAILVAFVGALDGWASYAPDEHQRTVAERVQELEDQAQIAEARGRLHQIRAKAMVGIATSTVKAFGRTDQEAADPSSASGASGASSASGATLLQDEADASDEAAQASPSPTPMSKAASARRIFSLAEAKRLHKQKADGSTQRLVFAFLQKHPTARLQEIQEATGVGRTAAAKYKKAYFQQHAATAAE